MSSDPTIVTAEEGAGVPAAGEPVAVAPPAPKKGTDWWGEIKAIFWLILAVLGFHSFIAKPFYIPSESMMPVLLKGDRLVVSKYPYGWSWVSLSFHLLPEMPGRLFGSYPERGDIVILSPPGRPSEDWIKRVIGLPGDTIELVGGQLYLNGKAVKREARPAAMIPIDDNIPCLPDYTGDERTTGPDGKAYCRLPIFRETLPSGRYYDTIDRGPSPVDTYPRIRVPDGHVFVMGDNRDSSADSRVSLEQKGLGGPVPVENIGGRAEFITFSLDGASQYYNPISWFSALRGGRAGSSLHPSREAPRESPAK